MIPNALPINIRIKMRVPTLSTPIQHHASSLSQWNKVTKIIEIGKEEIILSLFAKNYYICRKSQGINRKIPKTNMILAGLQDCKVNTQTSVTFLHNSSVKLETKFLKIYTIYIIFPKTEILRYKSNNICTESVHWELQKAD